MGIYIIRSKHPFRYLNAYFIPAFRLGTIYAYPREPELIKHWTNKIKKGKEAKNKLPIIYIQWIMTTWFFLLRLFVSLAVCGFITSPFFTLFFWVLSWHIFTSPFELLWASLSIKVLFNLTKFSLICRKYKTCPTLPRNVLTGIGHLSYPCLMG